jgi:hypothetical protein
MRRAKAQRWQQANVAEAPAPPARRARHGRSVSPSVMCHLNSPMILGVFTHLTLMTGNLIIFSKWISQGIPKGLSAINRRKVLRTDVSGVRSVSQLRWVDEPQGRLRRRGWHAPCRRHAACPVGLARLDDRAGQLGRCHDCEGQLGRCRAHAMNRGARPGSGDAQRTRWAEPCPSRPRCGWSATGQRGHVPVPRRPILLSDATYRGSWTLPLRERA